MKKENILFVGERRSKLAIKMGVTWKDGRLSAKQLFDALRFIHINPHECDFTNWFEEGGPEIVHNYKGLVVGMGHKVSKALTKENITHTFIYHPAARGIIRTKAIYKAHVRKQLEDQTIYTAGFKTLLHSTNRIL